MPHSFFFFNDTATTEIYTLPLHDALPISMPPMTPPSTPPMEPPATPPGTPPVMPVESRSEEHTSELQSQSNLVCRLLLEKKKKPTALPEYPRPLRIVVTARHAQP